VRQLVKMERMRRKISNDLHDDIGSTLSSINVYSQLAKSEPGNNIYIDTIQNNAVSIINSLDDLVWNINPSNDALGQLITRMRLFALPLLHEKGIECIFKTKLSERNVELAPNVRANIYLLFKEIVNNVIKHSGCSQCSIYIIQKGRFLRLTVTDNGRGFNIKNTNQHRNGLRILSERAKELSGGVAINSQPGSGTQIKINCYLK
jgi:signal transduction histidine kinase